MLHRCLLVCNVVDYTVDVNNACSIDIPGISHCAMGKEHPGCCMGGSLHAQLGYIKVTVEFSTLPCILCILSILLYFFMLPSAVVPV